jgi:DNA ligase (NAD+)
MDIPLGDDTVLAKLVGGGLVRDVSELYRLKPAEVAGLEGMNPDSARGLVEAIDASRNREGWRVLAGLNLPHVGAEEAQSLCRHFGAVDDVFAASAERLMEADGIGEDAARSIVHWHSDPENRRLLRRLQPRGQSIVM